MKRPFFWTFLTIAVTITALAAQEQQPPTAKGDKKEAGDKSQDIMAKLGKDLAAAEERLKKADPGEETRKIQKEIVDLLDELIKQNKQSSSGGGGSKSKKSSQQQSGSKSGKPDKSDNNKENKGGANPGNKDAEGNDAKAQAKPGKGENGKEKDKDKGKDGDNKEGVAKNSGKEQDKKGGKDDRMGQVKPGSSKDDKNSQLASGGKSKDQPPDVARKISNPNLKSEIWGAYLLEKFGPEIDAYSRERFMPRYEDLLQQYYRTIGEQAGGKQ